MSDAYKAAKAEADARIEQTKTDTDPKALRNLLAQEMEAFGVWENIPQHLVTLRAELAGWSAAELLRKRIGPIG